MEDPVVLPSGKTVDRSTAARQILSDPIDPFSRAPLKMEDLKPDMELKEQIYKWKMSKLKGKQKD